MTATFQRRIQLTLPPWWGSAHPNLDAITAGFAAGHASAYAQIEALRPLMRLNTTAGEMLDIAALDFYGGALARRAGELDATLRARIKSGLFQIRGTRPAFVAQVAALAGAPPVVIDPRRPVDTGIMGNVAANQVPTLFYNSVRTDVYTNFNMPYQWFVRVLNSSGVLSRESLAQQIAAMMPAGTVCWLNIPMATNIVYFNGIPVTFQGVPVTFGAPA